MVGSNMGVTRLFGSVNGGGYVVFASCRTAPVGFERTVFSLSGWI